MKKITQIILISTLFIYIIFLYYTIPSLKKIYDEKKKNDIKNVEENLKSTKKTGFDRWKSIKIIKSHRKRNKAIKRIIYTKKFIKNQLNIL